MAPTVLVTGGSGFIGTWVLRDLLQCGARPVVAQVVTAELVLKTLEQLRPLMNG